MTFNLLLRGPRATLEGDGLGTGAGAPAAGAPAAGAPAAGAPAAGAPAAAPAAGTPWYEGADAETIGFIQSKGWHDKPANAAALDAVKSYREAQGFIGVPPERIIKLPADAADEAGWKAAWARLGVPEKADGYDFSGVKKEDGTPALSEDQAAWLRDTALRLNLPKAAAASLAAEIVKREGGVEAAKAAERTAKLAEEHKALDANWGANKEGNTFLARKGAEKLGFGPEHVDALEGVVGYSKIMEALRQVGELSGEAKFISGGQGPNGAGGLMTREQAASRISELKQDSGWVSKYLAGDAAANREMLALNTILVGDDTAASVR